MKKQLITFGVAGALLLSGSAMAGDFNDIFGDSDPYIGLEYKFQKMKGKGDWNEIVADKFHNYGAFFGIKFHENTAVELGFNQSFKKANGYTFTAVGNLLGYTGIPAGTSLKSKVKTQSTYVDLVGMWAINNNWDFIASFGLNWFEAKFQDDGSYPTTQTVVNQMVYAKSRAKLVPRIGAGIEVKCNNCLKVRVKGLYENTNKVLIKDVATVVPKSNYKDSLGIAIGLSYYFL